MKSPDDLLVSRSKKIFLWPDTAEANHGVNLGSKEAYSVFSPWTFSYNVPNPLFASIALSLCFVHSVPGNNRVTPDVVATNWNLLVKVDMVEREGMESNVDWC